MEFCRAFKGIYRLDTQFRAQVVNSFPLYGYGDI